MVRFAVVAAALLFLIGSQDARAQASRYLEKKQPGNPQQNSWDQVDRINRESDGTKSRYNQSRQQAGLNKKGYTGGKITTSSIFPKTSKQKATPRKPAPAPKKRK